MGIAGLRPKSLHDKGTDWSRPEAAQEGGAAALEAEGRRDGRRSARDAAGGAIAQSGNRSSSSGPAPAATHAVARDQVNEGHEKCRADDRPQDGEGMRPDAYDSGSPRCS